MSLYYKMVTRPLKLLVSFDSEHFLYISKIGYTNEKNHAFFPGFPMVLNAINQYIQMANGKSKFDPEYDLGSDAMFLKFAFSL